MTVSKTRVEFFMRKLKWLDAVGLVAGRNHFTAHVAMIVARHMNSDTGETFVGRQTVADLIGGHVRTIELSIQKIEAWGFLRVQRARRRGHVNIYTMTFPEKAVSILPIVDEKAVHTPSFKPKEKAVLVDLKGGETVDKRRSPDRPNLRADPGRT